ncbi:hypothetical protein BCR42DRAFT_489185 [Absidia repens]|uniref:Peroxin-5 n=1 Tax=Absidia repens TaxID=90262 RepID=A0A1X2ISK2_9FUNG|nr:hypothetical protein BCR42DRAFT_489185 [Absidia repens]
METSQCRSNHVKAFMHHLYTKGSSSQKDQWVNPHLDVQQKPTFRSKHTTYADSLSPSYWSLEDFTKHGQSSYSHSLQATTLEQSRLRDPSIDDDLSASWSSSGTSCSTSLPSPDLDDQRHNGWLADFYSFPSPSPPTMSQQCISPAPPLLLQQSRTTRSTYHLQPRMSTTSTLNTHQNASTIHDKTKNWEMAFDQYENQEDNDSITTSTIAHNARTSSMHVDFNSYSLENERNNKVEVVDHGSRLETKEEANNTLEVPISDSRLQMEKNTMMDAANWNAMGMDLQETEQDVAAIDAFRHALDLDTTMLDAWLNLAISYTNEHQRGNVYDCLEAWLHHNEKYQHLCKPADDVSVVMKDRNTALIDRFILAARCAPGDTNTTTDEIDADVQVVLGILFYLADETQKSTDCFRAALACRPDDYRLWNQLGSVILSQQGMQASDASYSDAMDMYWSALYLNPVYTRARYNLAVAHMKLSQYDQAAHHLVTALTHQQKQQQQQQQQLQQASNSSSPMWSSLRLVMYMLKLDHLADACNRFDLAPFASFLDNPCTFTPHTQ